MISFSKLSSLMHTMYSSRISIHIINVRFLKDVGGNIFSISECYSPRPPIAFFLPSQAYPISSGTSSSSSLPGTCLRKAPIIFVTDYYFWAAKPEQNYITATLYLLARSHEIYFRKATSRLSPLAVFISFFEFCPCYLMSPTGSQISIEKQNCVIGFRSQLPAHHLLSISRFVRVITLHIDSAVLNMLVAHGRTLPLP